MPRGVGELFVCVHSGLPTGGYNLTRDPDALGEGWVCTPVIELFPQLRSLKKFQSVWEALARHLPR
jgi:hypothetical protein